MIKAILFDAFGTLCEIRNKQNPYKPIIRAWSLGVAAAYQTLMTKDISETELAIEAGCSAEELKKIQAGVQTEITSMCLYPVLQSIKERNLKWGIVSNLATPYAAPLLKLLPFQPDVCAWSFTTGYRKPEEGIYAYACEKLGLGFNDCLMVGDSLENDYNMPKKLGMQARYLKRSGVDKDQFDCIATLYEIL
ncbi:HAD family hydrolase [Desulfovibrio litoralis]|uniref:HAD-hyrolase-like n=1 Tax=Desulfovibrio litoralis DSM 11393 TaxID=1121455 RepID=A0A1M7SN28_9BACT|nr:HAD family hydrolase [Desulfovibrio litoralis]SHN59886.1 HAD-hyrolase-like [Desulfovibrio litoralis DSM 11393]